MALRELLDKNELQRLQDGFCKVSGLSAYCLDHDATKITRISGDDRYLHCLQEKLALERVQGEDALEDLAVEDMEGKKQVAAMSIAARGEKELYWILFRPEEMGDQEFSAALELLRSASITLLQGKLQSYGAEANTIRNQADVKKMGRSSKLNQCMSRITQLLDSGDAIETVMKVWLEAVSSFMELDTAQIFKLQEDEKFMDVICEWRREGESSYFDRASHVPAYAFLKKRESMVVNADTVTKPEYHEIFQIGVKSMMVHPVGPKEGSMIAVFNHRRTYVFDDVDEEFAADAIKILGSVLALRIQKNTLACAYSSMESVLDALSVCVMVRDETRKKPIYVNKLFQSTFEEELKGGTLEGLADKSELEAKDRRYKVQASDVRWVDGNVYRMYSLIDVTGENEAKEQTNKNKKIVSIKRNK